MKKKMFKAFVASRVERNLNLLRRLFDMKSEYAIVHLKDCFATRNAKKNGDKRVQTAIQMVPSNTIERRDGGVPRPCRHGQPIPAVAYVALWWGQRTATF